MSEFQIEHQPHPHAAGLIAHGREMLHNGEHLIDPVMEGFDHLVALACYGLMFVSVFLGLPALVAVIVAYFHRKDTHLLVRTHYRFQIRIFWTAALLLSVAIGAGIAGGTALFGGLFEFVQTQFTGLSAADGRRLHGWTVAALIAAAMVFWVLAALWTMGASVVGFVRLMANRPIGHLPAA
jgi:uncharacterized membrane protein